MKFNSSDPLLFTKTSGLSSVNDQYCWTVSVTN